MKMDKKTSAAILLLLMAMIWGASYIGVENAINAGWGPFSILFLRTVVASLVLLPFTLKDKTKTLEMYLGGALCGLCGFLGLIIQTYGQRLTTVSSTSFITSLYIVFVPIMTSLFYKRKEKPNVYIAVDLSIIGCFLLNMNFPLSLDKENLVGNLLVLLSAVFFALQIIFITKFTQKYGVIKLTCIECFSMAFYSLLGMVITGDYTITFDGAFVGVLLVGLFSSGLCSVLQMYGNKHLPESIAGILMGLESVFGAIFAVIIYHENMNIIKIIGCVMIFVGAVVCFLPPKKKENEIKN